jgi:hypothetical protein
MQAPQEHDLGSSDCSTSAEKAVLYLGHEKQYWGDMAINWMPFLFLCIFLFYLIAPGRGTSKKYRELYEQSVETQKKAYEEIQVTNKLLIEILKKLDAK